MDLKRLWDTENKKIVWAIPTGDPHTKLQVWTNADGSKLYVYDSSKWVELSNPQSADVEEYGPVWKALEDETVGYYLTNVPTDLYNWDSGDEVAYRFMNGTTVLQSGKVDEGETPEYTGDTPTKAATAQYTYTFSGWKPTLGPITKKTDFKALFDSTVNEYTVSIASNDTDYGTVSESSVADIPYGTALSVADNVLTIGTGTSAVTVTATAETGCEFSSWGTVPATVTGNTSITATFIPGPVNTAAGVVGGISLFGDASIDSDYVLIEVGTDEGTGNATVNTTAHGIYADSSLEVSGENVFVTLFNSIDADYLEIVYGGSTPNGTIQSDAYTALSNLYFNPSADNIAAAKTAIEVYENNDNESFIEWAGE